MDRFVLLRDLRIVGVGSWSCMTSECRILNKRLGFKKPKYHVLANDAGLVERLRMTERLSPSV